MKVNRILLVVLLAIIVVPAVSYFKWLAQKKTDLNLLIVDKTVPKFDAIEHKSLFWVLNHNGIKPDYKKKYEYNKDYYGFFPIKSKTSKEYLVKSVRLAELDSLVENNDILYYADAYGVFYSDWYMGLGDIENSTLIYGGFNQNDYYLLQKFKESGKLIIAEYELFGYPTNPLIRYKTQDVLGVKYTGWTGKYFKKLDEEADEVPAWIISKYKKMYNKSWPYKSSGIIFLNKNMIVVLEDKIHLQNAIPELQTSSYFSSRYLLPEKIPFIGWFEIIENENQNEEQAWFNVKVNSLGEEILSKAKIPVAFPAILGSVYIDRFLYFSGDFTENKILNVTSKFAGVEKVKDMFYSKDPDDNKKFFWEYYYPLMTGIIKENITIAEDNK